VHFGARLKDSSERRSDTREHDAPKDRGKNSGPQAGWIHENVKQRDVHDNGTVDRQRDRHESINQEQDARNHLQRKNGHDETNNAPKNCPATPLGGGVEMK
jgi:hypothetical protein